MAEKSDFCGFLPFFSVETPFKAWETEDLIDKESVRESKSENLNNNNNNNNDL